MTTPECPKGPEREARPYSAVELRDRIAQEISDADGGASSVEPCGDATYQQMAHAALFVVSPELERLTAELDLYRERDALTRKALQTDEDGPLQFLVLRVRQERDKALEEVSKLAVQLSTVREELAWIAGGSPETATVEDRLAAVGGDLRYHRAEVSRLREQLAAQPKALTLPDNWAQQVGWLFDVHGVDQYRKVVRLVQMWQGQRDGTADTEEEEARSTTSAASPIVHSVLLSSDTGVMGEWQAFCSGCRQRSVGDLAHAEFWKDQHLADVLVPQLQANSKLDQNLVLTPQQAADELSRETQEVFEGRPSGSTAAAPQAAPAPAWAKWTECRATEGATGIDCYLSPGHHQWHAGRHTPRTDGTESVGYPLNVQWPRQEWDICAPEKNVWQRGDREPDQIISAVRGFSTGNVYTRRLEGFGGPWDYETSDGRAWSTWDSLIEEERGAELLDAAPDAAQAARSEATPKGSCSKCLFGEEHTDEDLAWHHGVEPAPSPSLRKEGEDSD